MKNDQIKELCAEAQIPLYEYENANHSLEVGDAVENLRILEDVITQSREYLLNVFDVIS